MSGALDFVWPAAWPLLLLVPALVWFLGHRNRARARRLGDVVGPRAAWLVPGLDRGRRKLGRRLGALGLFLALVAVLQPRWGAAVREVEQRGVDLVVCVDVSRSMFARDLRPDRLTRAREQVAALAERAGGDRLALVAFAGEARLVAPLTQDMTSFVELAAGLDPLLVPRGGTDLGAALDVALAALDGGAGGHEAVILLTDGEDLEGRGLEVAERSRERGIIVHSVGFGSLRGSKIPVAADGGEVYLTDREGREVVSALDPTSLRRIAEATGGAYVDATKTPRPLVDLYERRVLPMSRKAFGKADRREKPNRFQWPLLGAFLAWMCELWICDRRPR